LPEVICNTSPLQYLHQLDLLPILRALAGNVTVPRAVVDELAAGHDMGISLPKVEELDWITIRRPASAAVLPLVTDLGPGETEVLALALEAQDPLVILDDAMARQAAEYLHIKFTGTLGLLLDAKRKGLVPTVAPLLNQLHALGFRLSARTRGAVLKLAQESGKP
jgi:predicted nucleic acid-binding protein